MSQHPSVSGATACSPYLFYDDVAAAVAFLTHAFGFAERFVDRDDKGHAHHAQVAHGAAVVMMGESYPATDKFKARKSPRSIDAVHAGVYLFVDDVDAHARRAREAGAEILMEPADMHWGDRLYCAADPEGQMWMFATPVRKVPDDQR